MTVETKVISYNDQEFKAETFIQHTFFICLLRRKALIKQQLYMQPIFASNYIYLLFNNLVKLFLFIGSQGKSRRGTYITYLIISETILELKKATQTQRFEKLNLKIVKIGK